MPGRRLLFLLALGSLAGCVGGEANQAASPGAAAGQESVPDADTGVLHVFVTDDSLQPIQGAVIGLLETSAQASSDAAGRAVFGDLVPGTYTAFAQQLGYESGAKKVDVAAGLVAELRFILAAIPVVDAYHQTYIFKGHITCGAGLIQVRLITVCGTTGTGTPAGNVTVDPNHKDEFKQLGQPGLQSLVGELVWSSSAPLSAREFTLSLYQGWRCTPFCSSDNSYGGQTGKSPVVHRAEGPFAGLKKGPAMISHIVGVPGQSADPPFVIFIVEQDYTIYSTHFFGEPAPPDFLVNPDA